MITVRDFTWEDWLQSHRVELNAMTTPQFIEWLSLDHFLGRNELADVILEARLEAAVRTKITERILRSSPCRQARRLSASCAAMAADTG